MEKAKSIISASHNLLLLAINPKKKKKFISLE